MKVALNQNDLGLYPLDDEFCPDCENCAFLRDSYTCILLNFGEEIFDKLPHCFNAIFILKPLSSIFKL